jgi:hypothetical protein
MQGSKSGPELIPTKPKARAKFEQAASIEYAHLDSLVSGIAMERLFKPMRGLATNEERMCCNVIWVPMILLVSQSPFEKRKSTITPKSF